MVVQPELQLELAWREAGGGGELGGVLQQLEAHALQKGEQPRVLVPHRLQLTPAEPVRLHAHRERAGA